MAQKQAEKAEKAKEEERLKELERRKMGQEVVKLKQWQKEQHMKEEMEEWKKEKAEQKREKERILRELARDRYDCDSIQSSVFCYYCYNASFMRCIIYRCTVCNIT